MDMAIVVKDLCLLLLGVYGISACKLFRTLIIKHEKISNFFCLIFIFMIIILTCQQ